MVFGSRLQDTAFDLASYAYIPTSPEAAIFPKFTVNTRPLDDGGTANCYIAPELNTSYSFDATTMGNGRATTNIVPKRLAGAEAKVLWETGTIRGAIVESAELTGDGRIVFRTGMTCGNAVIGLLDSRGVCIWSWHIWSVDYEIEATAQTYASGAVFMDRNLGALATDCTQAAAKGLYYQWGRKDPFIGANRIQKNYTDEYEGVGFQTTGDNGFTALFLYNDALCEGFKFVNKEMDMSMSIANPTVFYGVYNSGGWKGSNSEVEDYWGGASGTKTNNDPCPAGYRVPTFDEINGFIKDIDTNKTAQENVSDQSYGRKYTVGDQTFMFPGSALRVWSAKMRYPGRVTFFWSSTISPTTEKKALDFYDYRWNTNADNTCCAMAVRCIKIQ